MIMRTKNQNPRQKQKPKKGFLAAAGLEKNRHVHTIDDARRVIRYERELMHTTRKGLVQKTETTMRGDKYPYGRVQIISPRGKEAARVGMIVKTAPRIGKIYEIWGIDTKKGWKKEGLARQALSEAIHVARQNKAKAIELDPTLKNK